MKAFTDTYNLLAGMIVSIMTAIFGMYWYIFAAYFLLNILDWLTGWYNSRRKKTESSSEGLRGIVKKLGYWIIIAVAFLMSTVFVRLGNDILGINLDFLMMIGWFTLACLMINEARSILENLVECGCDVPEVLVSGLKVADEVINQEHKEESEEDGNEKTT